MAALSRVVASFGLALASAALLHGQEKRIGLTAEEKSFLDRLLGEILFDPRGAERVAVRYRDVRGETTRHGWLLKEVEGERVYFTDGESMKAPERDKRTKVDFVARCREAIGRLEAGTKAGRPASSAWAQANFREPSVLVAAAWLHGLGEGELAARALRLAGPDRAEGLAALRRSLARRAFLLLVDGFARYEDESALSHGERLLRLYPVEALEFTRAGFVVGDLKRRQREGTLGKKAARELPADFASWETRKKTSYLIASLQDVDASLHLPEGPAWSKDARIVALLALGDAAMPELIEALEKDERMTRAVYARHYLDASPPIAVRVCVFDAIRAILGVSEFDPRGEERGKPAEAFADYGGEQARQAAGKLREYWREFGPLPFPERLMKVINDPRSHWPAVREAASRLGNRGRMRLEVAAAPVEMPAGLSRFEGPSVAEAILSAMDRDPALRGIDPGRAEIEDGYVASLIGVGDRRIGGELSRRAAKERVLDLRRKWCLAALRLGQPGALRTLADETRTGEVRPASVRELEGLVHYLAVAGLPEADGALMALADPKHVLHEQAARAVIESCSAVGGLPRVAMWEHPFCLRVLRQALEDRTATGAVVESDGRSVVWTVDGLVVAAATSAGKARKLRQRMNERVCDKAAVALSLRVAGMPRYQPLLDDAGERLEAIKAMLDRFGSGFRRPSAEEERLLPLGVLFVPDLKPLGRAASRDDVDSGRAVFHLEGKGKPADLGLPACGVWLRDARVENPPGVLIVQAEIGPDGEAAYGVIEANAIRAVPAREFARVTPLGKK